MSKHPDVFTVELAEGQGEAFPSASFDTALPIPVDTATAVQFQKDYAAARDRATRAKALRELAADLKPRADEMGVVEISIGWLERRAKSVEAESLDAAAAPAHSSGGTIRSLAEIVKEAVGDPYISESDAAAAGEQVKAILDTARRERMIREEVASIPAPTIGPTRIDRLEWIANQLAWAVLDNVPGKPGDDAVQAIFLEADRRFPPRTK